MTRCIGSLLLRRRWAPIEGSASERRPLPLRSVPAAQRGSLHHVGKPAETLRSHLGGEHLVAFRATANVTRHFCKVCGSHVFTSDKRYPKILGVPAGIIEGQLSPAPKAHYFVRHKAAWHTINDGLPQFGGESGFESTAA